MAEVLSVLTTVGSQEEARVLAAGAVERRVAACAQISGAVTSVYRWEGAVQTDPEWQVLFKTAAGSYDALESYLNEAHPYDVPEIIATPVVRGGAAYLEWVRQETQETQESQKSREA
ncbi:divalent-cation tolerance protein CutA [Streptomyces tubbatahanensis]|uniref:Divalent-cation tolerance protein CutA n=1 Tax=Streptomyces tubbatahanensis TaxID=2923272 RepID=A0ABY3XR90_9ACTN|nr:divalent-cation tolerance protein CutA [Streptomyces tubbatahanensis]UNS96910.1 divalent-cation tolerance protein CutA [Streptomyces tubbatahanensis]